MPTAKRNVQALSRVLLVAMPLCVALISLLGPDHLLSERHISMSKSASAEEAKSVRGSVTPPARDPKIAVEEEYQLARQRGTAQALELFISRHPDDPLADKARADLKSLSR
jgi:hypothetical protein